MCTVWHVKYILWIFLCIKHASRIKESCRYTKKNTVYSPGAGRRNIHTTAFPNFRGRLLLIEKYQDKNQWTSAAHDDVCITSSSMLLSQTTCGSATACKACRFTRSSRWKDKSFGRVYLVMRCLGCRLWCSTRSTFKRRKKKHGTVGFQ